MSDPNYDDDNTGPPYDWLMRVAIAAREFCEDWKKGDFSLSTLAAFDAQSIVDALETPYVTPDDGENDE